MNRYLRVLLAAGVVVGAFIGFTALAAQATPAAPVQGEPVCATWKARGATGEYPAITFGGKPAGTVVGDYTVKLTKPTTGANPGVEFASFDLGVGPLAGNTLVSVEYATSGGASTSAGAIRMFAYHEKNANTITDAPDHQAVASSESGILVFEVPAGKKIGTLGLVFDASNNTEGAVTFSGMSVGNRAVRFTACPPIRKPVVEPSASSSSPIKKPPVQASSSASPSASTSSTPVAVAGPSLPVTGSQVGMVAAAGLGLIAIGGAGILISVVRRRNKVRYQA